MVSNLTKGATSLPESHYVVYGGLFFLMRNQLSFLDSESKRNLSTSVAGSVVRPSYDLIYLECLTNRRPCTALFTGDLSHRLAVFDVFLFQVVLVRRQKYVILFEVISMTGLGTTDDLTVGIEEPFFPIVLIGDPRFNIRFRV